MRAGRRQVAGQFGDGLRVHRKRAGLSQEELGFRASLHRTEIGLLERGKREPRLNTIVKLAGALSVSIEDLLAGVDWRSEGLGGGR